MAGMVEDGKKNLSEITEITDISKKTEKVGITGKTKPKERIRAFDILRGTSILLMLIAHIGNYWLTPDSKWLVGFFFLIFNVQGTNGFTFVAGVGFGYSWWRSLSQSSKASETSRKLQYGKNPQIKRSVIHTLFIFGISICFNIIAATVRQSNMWFEYVWYWNILQTIAVCRALGMILLRLKIRYRLVILAIIIPLVHFLTPWIVPDLIIGPMVIGSGSDLRAFLYYFLYNPLHADGLLFFLPFFILGSVAGELIWKNKAEFLPNAKISPKGTKLMCTGIIMGVLLMIAGIGLGWNPVPYDYGWYLLQQLNTHPSIQWVGIPLFLVANSAPWTLYSLGFELLFLIFIFRCVDIKKSSRLKPATRLFIVELFGRFSLTIYLGHYLILFLPWFRWRFTETTIWIPFFLFMGVISLCAWGLNKQKFRSLLIEYHIQTMIRHYS
ncbi:MAG: heparan-alpha-glucosaminide N-acetyltransferase domain-containing protein [Promethearchaeota archaeon]